MIRRDDEAAPGRQIRVPDVDVGFGQLLKDGGGRTGGVCDRHQRDLLLLHDAEAGGLESSAGAREIWGKHVNNAANLGVAVDVDARTAHAAERLGQHAGSVLVERDRQIRVEMRHRSSSEAPDGTTQRWCEGCEGCEGCYKCGV